MNLTLRLSPHLLQTQALLVAAETRLSDAKKQYDTMLESKQMELSRHLKEISHRNDQVLFVTILLINALHAVRLPLFRLTAVKLVGYQ